MSGFADRVKTGYRAASARLVEAPEWGITFRVWPLTIEQLSIIEGESDVFRRAARILQVRGKDENGRRIFDDEDFAALCTHGVGDFGPETVLRIANEIQADLMGDEAPSGNH